MKTKLSVLKQINKVYKEVAKNGISTDFERSFPEELEFLSKYFKTDKTEAFFMTIIFSIIFEKANDADIRKIADVLKCNTLDILEYNKVLESLIDKDYLIKKDHRGFRRDSNSNYSLIINKKITEKILANEEFPNLTEKKYEQTIDFVEAIFELTDNDEDKMFSWIMLLKKIEKLINKNKHLPLVKKLNKFKIDIKTQYVYYNLIWRTLIGNNNLSLVDIINDLKMHNSMKVRFMQVFVNAEKNKLLKFDLIGLYKNDFINEVNIYLTDKSVRILEKEEIKLLLDVKKTKPRNVKYPKDIKKINLFFDKKETEQIDLFKSALMQKKYIELQARLQKKNLPTGLTAIFFGYPGTGKTESVYQIAKATGRAIMQVDISQTKSKWFGDSEKEIKKVFQRYYDFKRDSKKTPILLFNEADAIISKRKDASSSNVSQTENAIQNIILEELENFDGIFIATTNLVDNMDTAFERRFLFKIEFNKPSEKIISKIWKAKLNILSISQCNELAANFDFTGGEINNIIRKIETFEIINNKKISFEKLKDFCLEERFTKHSFKTIGFAS